MNEQHSYRRAAIEGASSVSLTIMLYDRMVSDMQRALSAMQSQDVETRCAQLKHALLILQQLEGSLDHGQGGVAAQNLQAFYAYVRARIMEAQFKLDPSLLAEVVQRIQEVKAAWQKIEQQTQDRSCAEPDRAKLPRGEASGFSCSV